MKVQLPDGTPLELPDGATGADAAARDRRGPRPRRARHPRARRRRGARAARPRRAAAPTASAIEIVTAPRGRRRRALAVRHDAAHVLATAVHRALPGREDLDRPADRGRLLLRLRVPRGRQRLRGRPAAHRAEDARARQGRRARSSARDVPVGRGARALQGRGPGLQGRADRGPRARTRASRRVSLYRNGPFTDLCRGPHAPDDQAHQGVQAHRRVAGAYWRGDADRTMLTRIYGTAFLSQGGPRGAPRAPRGGARPRPPQARPRARPVHALRAVARARRSGCRTARTSGTS